MKYLVLTTALFAIAACGGMGMDKKEDKMMDDGTYVTPKSEAAKMSFADTRKLSVKTYEMMNGARTEVSGATCSFDSPLFTASVMTPGYINMPIMTGEMPGELNVSCTKEGMTGTMTYAAVPVALGTEASTVTDSGAVVAGESMVKTNAYVYNGVADVMPLQTEDNTALQQAQTAVMNIEVDLK